MDGECTAKYEGYIGVFDSGVGGISVLRELIKQLPGEDFLYFGDSANAPYGEKTTEQVRSLCLHNIGYLCEQGVKAIVVACNTATSAAIEEIRNQCQGMPVIGVEPAIKPAASSGIHKKVLVMATPVTLKLEKYRMLQQSLDGLAEFIPVECAGLAARIEKGNLDAPDMMELLYGYIGCFKGKVDSAVLGCTHYPFIKRQILTVLGDIPLYDGAAGTAKELRRRLKENGLLKDAACGGKIVLKSSLPEESELALYDSFLKMEL